LYDAYDIYRQSRAKTNTQVEFNSHKVQFVDWWYTMAIAQRRFENQKWVKVILREKMQRLDGHYQVIFGMYQIGLVE
jgi:hypothetical protein